MKKQTKIPVWQKVAALILIAASFMLNCSRFINWDSRATVSLSLFKNVSEKTSPYYAVYADTLELYQQTGDSSCEYALYYAKRGEDFVLLQDGITFDTNKKKCHVFFISPSWWRDVRFKVIKTAGNDRASELVLMLEKKR